jgi:urease alpha subunit
MLGFVEETIGAFEDRTIHSFLSEGPVAVILLTCS